jgi:predicted RNase H-like HicB family nuclease/DNA-binding XRE family transcriptional regulator
MRYAALIDAHGERLIAEFPDCPGCQASARTPDDIVAAARTALHRWLESCLVDGTSPPRPSVAVVSRDWFEWIDVEPELARRLLLHWAVARRISRSELARRAGVSEDAIASLQDESVPPTAELLNHVARALGVVGESAHVPAPSTPAKQASGSKRAPRTPAARTRRTHGRGAR